MSSFFCKKGPTVVSSKALTWVFSPLGCPFGGSFEAEIKAPGGPGFVLFHRHSAHQPQASPFIGKYTHHTRTRQRISRANPSVMLLVRNFLRCCSGKANTVRPSGRFSSNHWARRGARFSISETQAFNGCSAWARLGALNISRMRAATSACIALRGT